jgi:diadenylate cyclase
LGRSSVIPKNLKDMEKEDTNKTVKAITDAVGSLARQKIGAIIIIEKKVGLNEYIESGTLIDGDVSAELLINIFIPNTPLHDGAVIIRGDKIVAAACFLPLSDNTSISKEMGTRHRAALGISEKSDSLSIVVSEETGIISIAENGKISRHLDVETLEQILNKIYTSTDDSAFAGFWRNINEQDKANIDK